MIHGSRSRAAFLRLLLLRDGRPCRVRCLRPRGDLCNNATRVVNGRLRTMSIKPMSRGLPLDSAYNALHGTH